MNNKFGGVIWTNHALERLRERGIKQGDAWATWRRPDQSRYASAKGAWIYYKTWGNTRVEVVAKQNERKEWVILSVWSRSADAGILAGKPDAKKETLMRKIVKKMFRLQ